MKNKGITLVALVVTVIVLLILAGVAIRLAVDGGIITQSQDAANQYEEGLRNDAEFLAKQEKDQDDVNGAEPPPLPPPAGEPTSIQFSRAYGVIDIVWLDLNNKVISKPLTIGASELSGLVPVKWTGVPGSYTEQTGIQDDPSSLSDWYEYVAGTGNSDNNNSRWANAKTTNGNAYFVWIPRYAYKITYFDTQVHANDYRTNSLSTEGIIGYSNIFGFVNASDQLVIGSEPTNVTGTVITSKYSDYIPHPAFEFDGAKKGIWVGKYESSGSVSTIEIKPLVPILVDQYLNSFFNLGLGVKGTYSLNGETHMMKNVEWGAVAYLTESKHGRNGTEVTVNNYYVGNDMYSRKLSTGYAGGSVSASPDNTGTNTYSYNTIEGVLASTTGNIYGIYDMSGGTYTYVTGNLLNNTIGNLIGSVGAAGAYGVFNTIYNGSDDNLKNQYFDFYKYGGTATPTATERQQNYELSLGKKGDAIMETSTEGNGYTSWHEDYSSFLYLSTPWFVRGGLYMDGKRAGVFHFSPLMRR